VKDAQSLKDNVQGKWNFVDQMEQTDVLLIQWESLLAPLKINLLLDVDIGRVTETQTAEILAIRLTTSQRILEDL